MWSGSCMYALIYWSHLKTDENVLCTHIAMDVSVSYQQQQQQDDVELMQHHGNKFLEEWFANPSWWFGCKDEVDEYLSRKYSSLLFSHDKINDILCKIIVLDQLPRHLLRHQSANHIISYYLERAVECLQYLDSESLCNAEWCFAMLPIRHKGSTKSIHHVLATAWERLSKEPTCAILQRFIKASYQRCPVDDQSSFITKYLPHATVFDVNCFTLRKMNYFWDTPKDALIIVIWHHWVFLDKGLWSWWPSPC